jgi:dephospho-CoA kinase
MKRNGYSHNEALSRIRAQLAMEEKMRLADETIDNSGSVEDTRKQVLGLLDKYR